MITLVVRKRKQDRFRRSMEGAMESNGGAWGAQRRYERAQREQIDKTALTRIADMTSFFCSGTSRVAESTIGVQYAIFASAERKSWKDDSRRIRLFAKDSIVLGMAAENLTLLSSGYNSTFEAFTMAREFLALTMVRNIPLAVFRTILRYIADRLRSENTNVHRKSVRQRTSLLPV